jgi:hypothetical protein
MLVDPAVDAHDPARRRQGVQSSCRGIVVLLPPYYVGTAVFCLPPNMS